jgi:hypothetical protein
MSALSVSGQKRKATQKLGSPKHKKSRPDDADPEEWLLKCGTADPVVCAKLRKKLNGSPEYMLLPSDDARKAFFMSRVTCLLDNRDDAGISKAAQEAIVIAERVRQDTAAREAERGLATQRLQRQYKSSLPCRYSVLSPIKTQCFAA